VGFGQSGDQIALTDSTRLEVTSGAGSTQVLERGNIDIGANAALDIQAGAAVVAGSGTINNHGSLLVSGRLEPRGTMTGDGFIRVQTGGQLGAFGSDGTDMFTTSTDIFMEGLSTFEVLINPMALSSQRLIANGEFTLSSLIGVYLDPLILPNEDALLAYGTKFAIADYLDGNDLIGHFIRDDRSIINEGGLITEGLNTFRVSYMDPDYMPGNSSVITLTTVAPAGVPEPSTSLLAAIGLVGGALVRRRKRKTSQAWT
jgi:hypothetical protein